MIYQMKQKLFSLGDDFSIRDADGREKFFVDGKVFALGHTLEFKDPSGNVVAQVRKNSFRWERSTKSMKATRSRQSSKSICSRCCAIASP